MRPLKNCPLTQKWQMVHLRKKMIPWTRRSLIEPRKTEEEKALQDKWISTEKFYIADTHNENRAIRTNARKKIIAARKAYVAEVAKAPVIYPPLRESSLKWADAGPAIKPDKPNPAVVHDFSPPTNFADRATTTHFPNFLVLDERTRNKTCTEVDNMDLKNTRDLTRWDFIARTLTAAQRKIQAKNQAAQKASLLSLFSQSTPVVTIKVEDSGQPVLCLGLTAAKPTVNGRPLVQLTALKVGDKVCFSSKGEGENKGGTYTATYIQLPNQLVLSKPNTTCHERKTISLTTHTDLRRETLFEISGPSQGISRFVSNKNPVAHVDGPTLTPGPNAENYGLTVNGKLCTIATVLKVNDKVCFFSNPQLEGGTYAARYVQPSATLLDACC